MNSPALRYGGISRTGGLCAAQQSGQVDGRPLQANTRSPRPAPRRAGSRHRIPVTAMNASVRRARRCPALAARPEYGPGHIPIHRRVRLAGHKHGDRNATPLGIARHRQRRAAGPRRRLARRARAAPVPGRKLFRIALRHAADIREGGRKITASGGLQRSLDLLGRIAASREVGGKIAPLRAHSAREATAWRHQFFCRGAAGNSYRLRRHSPASSRWRGAGSAAWLHHFSPFGGGEKGVGASDWRKWWAKRDRER